MSAGIRSCIEQSAEEAEKARADPKWIVRVVNSLFRS